MLFIFSCEKEDISSKVIEINGNIIRVQNEMLAFNDPGHFSTVVKDYYNNRNFYDNYFSKNRPILNAQLAYNDFLLAMDSRNFTKNEELLNFIITDGVNVRLEDDELLPLFNMDYKNMFCNIQGFVKVGDFVYKYDGKGRYKYDAKDYNATKNIKNNDYELLTVQSKVNYIQNRNNFVAGSCTDEFDIKRIKCRADIDIENFSTQFCPFNFEAIAEAENRFQIKFLGFWKATKADFLSIDIRFKIRDPFGVVVLNMHDHRESKNNNNTKWGFVDSFCTNCTFEYNFEVARFDFFGNDDDISFMCNLQLNLKLLKMMTKKKSIINEQTQDRRLGKFSSLSKLSFKEN